MAFHHALGEFKNQYTNLKGLDLENFLKPQYEHDSLNHHIGREFRQVWDRYDKADVYVEYSNEDEVNELARITKEIVNIMTTMIRLSAGEYTNRVSNQVNNIRELIKRFNDVYFKLQLETLDSIGNIRNFDFENKFRPVEEKLTKQFEEKGSEIILKAEELAKKIEEKARDTATKVSIEKAKQVFEKAEVRNARTVRVWSLITGVGYGVFIGLAIGFYWIGLPDKSGTPEAIYHSVMRVTLLAIVGAFSTFALKVLRSRLHLREHNMHRLRITECMPAFVESAFTGDQRDMILTRMVDAVASFGNSGLVSGEDDSSNAPKMTVDNIMRTFVSPTKS